MDKLWLVFPRHKDEVDGNAGENDENANAGLHGAGDHGDDGDIDGGQDVQDREDQVNLDGPLPFRVLPAEPGQAEHCQTNGHLEVENFIRKVKKVGLSWKL